MKYVFLAAGKGTRLQPLTISRSKVLYKLDRENTVLQRMVRLIRRYDHDADIVVVVGFMQDQIRAELEPYGVTFIENPFYAVTNSIGSLWFAREHLLQGGVTLIDADIVMDDDLIENVLCKPVDRPYVLLDSSVKNNGDYNVAVNGEHVVVMSKQLDEYYGEYACTTLLDANSARMLHDEIVRLVNEGQYDQWYEDALVQMIFDEGFELYYKDICDSRWTEVDCVSDMLFAKRINESTNY